MSSLAVDPDQSKKHSDIENNSNPQRDVASRSSESEGHLQPPHGLPSLPSETLELFISVVLIAIIMLCSFSFTAYCLADFFTVPEDLVVRLSSFTATRFNITSGKLDATWQADIIVNNPNVKFKAYVSGMDSWIYYTERGNWLAYGSRSSFSLDPKSNTTIIRKSSVSTKYPPQRWVVDDMEKERNGGSVNLGLEIMLVGDFVAGSVLTAQTLRTFVYCRDIKVVFPAGSTTGTLATGDKPMECSPDKSDW